MGVECASSKCGSSSPSGSEDAISLSPFNEKTLSANAGADVHHRSILGAPVWVANGLKGDASAWLLVFPKSCLVPKSPNDAVLLGPYVATKNTFLEEGRIGGGEARQRRRALSLGASQRSLA